MTNGGIRNRVLWAVRHLGMGVDDRVLQKTALTFDAAGWEFFAPLVSGGAVALAGKDARGDPAAIVTAAAETGSTILQLVPSMLQLVVDEPGLDRCSALRLVSSAGERLAPELCERLRDRLPVDVVNTYGPTEASIDATAWRYRAGHPAGVPIGSPLDNVRILVLDPAGGLVPVGVAGEIHVGGDGVARGYLGRPDLTAERFVPDPYGAEPGRRLYRTGDLARWGTDANLEFLGRLDDQVKVRGVRVEPGEIEVALAEHEGVARAAVTVRSGAAGLPQLVAYVVPGAGEVDPDVLRSHLLRRIPGPLVPDLFVSLDRLPLTSSGKIDRALLPDPQMPDETAHAAPRTPTEISIAAIWREVLRVDRIGVDDSFFLLGGHSLLATQMLSRVRAAFDVDVSLRDVFVAHTVARLAEVVARAHPETALPPLVRAPRDRPLPLSFGQERLWFLDRLEPGSSEYLVPVAVRIRGRLDAGALEQALCELVARHEILRTRYENAGGEPVPVIDEPAPLPLARVDLTSAGGAEPGAAIEALFASEKSKSFDLATGPVLRATLARLGDGDHLLLIVAHHIAFDGWSTSVVARELDGLYSAFSAGRAPDLPPPALQYGDVAVWQRGHLTAELRDVQLDYWRKQLAGLEILDFPTDRPRPQVRDAKGATVPVRIPPSVGKRALEFGRANGATPFMTFLAAFALVVSRYGDTEDVAIGTPIAGRTRSELESIVGFFVNTLVLRLRTGGAETFADLLARVRETALDAYAHQDLPFERLVDDLQPRRDLSRNPIFQVMLVLQNTERRGFRLDGAQMEEVDVDWGTAKFDLTLQLEELADGSTGGELEYATSLFDPETAERLARRYEHTLATVLADPTAPLEQLELLPPEERRLLPCDSPVADVPEPEGALHDVIDERAAATPGAVAVVGGGIEMTYEELRRRSNALARELLAKGVTAEEPVVICLDRSPHAVIALLATLKAGGVYVPFDPGHPSRRLGLMLDDVGARVAISTRAQAVRLEELGLVCVLVDDPDATAYGTEDLRRETDPEQLAYVIYTSGSTGSPKGVMISHRSYAHHCAVIAREYGIEADDRVVLLSALTFDVAMDQIGATLAAGAAVVVADPRFWSPAELPDKLAAHRVTVIEITPAYYRAMLDTVEPDDERLRGVKLMNVGSDVVTLDDVQRWHRTGLPGRFLCNYGPTEATVTCLLYPPSRQDQELRPEATAPVGRPVPGTYAYVVDADLR
ncbi:MAG: AMP-binding protein, partial [Actinomycetota bacterium]|nr:AMP-binding protein [Actinomycetota bacterium]